MGAAAGYVSRLPPVDVQPETFDAASVVFGRDLAGALWQARGRLATGLADSGGMAGDDAAGQAFAATYDPAAATTAGGIEDLANACATLGSMLQRTGFNHGLAESASDPTRSVPTPPDRATYHLGGPACFVAPPSARGGSGSAPFGWHLIAHVVGYAWPNGHQDRLRAAGRAWTSAGGQLDGLVGYVAEAVEAISTQRSPEVADALAVCAGMKAHLRDVADAARGVGRACEQYAGHLDAAHRQIEHELVNLAEWTAGIEAGGILLGAITLGAGEGGAQAVELARAASTGATVDRIIVGLIEAAGTAARTIDTVAARVAGVSQRLKVILGARLSRVTTDAVESLPEVRTTRTTEELAAERLEEASNLPDLTTTRAQIEKKFEHARDFGVPLPRGVAGFEAFDGAVDAFIKDSSTIRKPGWYRNKPAILNYDPVTKLVVVQQPNGIFVSGWKMSEAQLKSVIELGRLGGG